MHRGYAISGRKAATGQPSPLFSVRSTHAIPSYVIGAVRALHTSSKHELRIDLPFEHLLAGGRVHSQCALWGHIPRERKIGSLEQGHTVVNGQGRQRTQSWACPTLRRYDSIRVGSIEGASTPIP